MKISVLVDGRDQLEWKHMAEAVNVGAFHINRSKMGLETNRC
jgi:hypothetical protein